VTTTTHTPQELAIAREVATLIEKNPDALDMTDWVRVRGCGTVACIAGWAVVVGDGLEAIKAAEEDPEEDPLEEDDYAYTIHPVTGARVEIERRAGELLGLDKWEAGHWFYAPQADVTEKGIRAYMSEMMGVAL
jgi:hypothetical protein